MPSLAELLHEREWRRSAADPAYFMEHFVQIKHPEHGTIPFKLFSYQKETLDTVHNNKRILVLKARQIGYTTVMSAYMLWFSIFQEHRRTIVLSRTQDDAIDLVGMVKHAWRYLPDWMHDRAPKLVTDNLQQMTWNNGSSIEALASRDEPARGRSPALLVMDEWAFYNNPEKAWASAGPAAEVGGKVVALSTANGAGSLFYEQWVKATTGSSQFVPLFYPWWAREGRDQQWYDAQRQDYQEWQLHQEYPSDPEEAFIKSGNTVFDVDTLRALVTEEPTRGFLQKLGPKAQRFVPSPDGELHVWQTPTKYHRYVIGADVAEGLEHGDYSVAHVIDTKTLEVVAKWRGHVAPDAFGSEVLYHLGLWYWGALVGVESNNHGYSTLVELRNKRYPRLYYQTSYDQRTNQRSRRLGWRTQVNTKPLMIDMLAKHLRATEHQPALLTLRDSQTIGELLTFVREGDGKMHGSPFDDQVMSLAIANQMVQHWGTEEFSQRPEDTPFTLDWWANLKDGDDDAPYGLGDLCVRGTG